MRVASTNLNKRLGNPESRGHFCQWLRHNQIGLVVAQEPWARSRQAQVDLPGFDALGGNASVFAWIQSQFAAPTCRLVSDSVQRIELEYLVLYNCYLDAYSRESRARQLEELSDIVAEDGDRPVIVVGDFNLAPRPEDGLCNGAPSKFNSEVDRGPFLNLLTKCYLCDATSHGAVEYTIERSRANVISRFRCDLALVTDYVSRSVQVRYEHSSRLSETSFSDHSAIILDLPVSPRASEEQSEWLFADLAQEVEAKARVCSPHKTAMARSEQSPIAVAVLERLLPSLRATSILDYGCGRGADVAYYRTRGVPSVAGYDPHPGFGFASEPTGTFDIVTVVFVLNVLPDPWVRLQVLKSAANYLAPDGALLVVTRSGDEIESRARIGGWDRHNDGYWSSRTKGTFQRGLDRQDILDLARRVGLQEHEHSGRLRFDQAATSHLLLRRALDA